MNASRFDSEHTRAFLVRNIKRGSVFLLVGGAGFVIDAVVYNVLVFGGGEGPLFDYPLVAKTIAILVGLVATYFGNKILTYRDRHTPMTVRQVSLYALANVIAILLQLGCLAFSRYVLGLDGPLADNFFGTFIGQGLATGFRYYAYTRWVYRNMALPIEHPTAEHPTAELPTGER